MLVALWRRLLRSDQAGGSRDGLPCSAVFVFRKDLMELFASAIANVRSSCGEYGVC